VHRRAWHGCRSSRSASPGVHRTRGQDLLDAFTAVYNHQRPHRSLPHRATPATAYAARPKAVAGDWVSDSHDRVRSDRISKTGNVTLRTGGRLHHKRKHPGPDEGSRCPRCLATSQGAPGKAPTSWEQLTGARQLVVETRSPLPGATAKSVAVASGCEAVGASFPRRLLRGSMNCPAASHQWPPGTAAVPPSSFVLAKRSVGSARMSRPSSLL
jgi:hypothetical protein